MTTTPTPVERAAWPERPDIPRYAMLDIWMSLYGADSAWAFEDHADEHGYADTWAYICAEVRRRSRLDVDEIARELARHASLVGVPDEGTECECGDVITEDPEFYAVSAWREHQARAVVAHLTGATR